MKRSIPLMVTLAIALPACQSAPETPEAVAREFAIALQAGGGSDRYCLKPDFGRVTRPLQINPTDAVAVVQGASVPPPELGFPERVHQVVVQIGDDTLPLTVWPTQDYRAYVQQAAKQRRKMRQQLGTAAGPGLETAGPGPGEISDRKTCVLGLPN